MMAQTTFSKNKTGSSINWLFTQPNGEIIADCYNTIMISHENVVGKKLIDAI